MAILTDAQKAQLKIYYYFMLCDGQLSPEESNRLSTICKETGISQTDKDKLISGIENRQHYVALDGSVDTERVFNAMKNLLKGNSDTSIIFSYNKRLQLSTMWNLIMLSKADGLVSDAEMEYISFLRDKWSIDEAVISEFFDTAETITMLSKKWEWVLLTGTSRQEIEQRQAAIDYDINRLSEYVQRTIETTGGNGGIFGAALSVFGQL